MMMLKLRIGMIHIILTLLARFLKAKEVVKVHSIFSNFLKLMITLTKPTDFSLYSLKPERSVLNTSSTWQQRTTIGPHRCQASQCLPKTLNILKGYHLPVEKGASTTATGTRRTI
jgi:hypothetical protein